MLYVSIEEMNWRLMWVNAQGNVVHDYALSNSNCSFLWRDGDLARVLSREWNYATGTNSYLATSCAISGILAERDTIFAEHLPSNSVILDPACAIQDEKLYLFTGHWLFGTSPTEYRVRLTIYDGETSTHFPEWDPGPGTHGKEIVRPSAAVLDSGRTVYGYGVYDDPAFSVVIKLIGADGLPEQLDYSFDLPQDTYLSKLCLDYRDRSVFAAYSHYTIWQTTVTGVFLAALPLTSFTGTPEPPRAELPESLSLRTSPNPFNSELEIHYELPAPQEITIDIYDLLGRRKAELFSGQSARQGALSWSPQSAASGMYIIRLRAKTGMATSRVIYLK